MPNNGDVELLQQLIQHGGTQAFSLVPAALKNVLIEKQWLAAIMHDAGGFLHADLATRAPAIRPAGSV